MTGFRASSSKLRQAVLNKTTERRGGRLFLLHIVTCAETSLIEVVVYQGIDNLMQDWLGWVFILPKTIFSEELLTSQDGGTGAKEHLWGIGFSADSAIVITDTQGIDSMEELDILTDGETENLCKVISRHSGINPITDVAKLGSQVSLRAGKNLKLARLFLKHKTHQTIQN